MGQLSALGDFAQDEILCAISSMAIKNKTETNKKARTKRAIQGVREGTRPQDPSSQDPRDHKAQPLGITSHPGNESGETKDGKTFSVLRLLGSRQVVTQCLCH